VAVAAATGAVAVCPGYAWAITTDRGSALGQDAAGHTVEWVMRESLAVGFFLAAASSLTLRLVVLWRRA
jgi:hypothetical protein